MTRLWGALLLLLAMSLAGSGSGQQVSPLQGQGTPRPETTEVFVSMYLDRLLNGAWPQRVLSVQHVVLVACVSAVATGCCRQLMLPDALNLDLRSGSN